MNLNEIQHKINLKPRFLLQERERERQLRLELEAEIREKDKLAQEIMQQHEEVSDLEEFFEMMTLISNLKCA
ncbi:unnamed protein product [Protopolystoma xenopodis]|uniref:Uncharacterized protein n=1 Tax=Protopolystoma xenopodis TaxID=117903 RepID=A0A3S5AFS7_9PLAT|nr:unnamed protein product [Protopolystoma xenopodis]